MKSDKIIGLVWCPKPLNSLTFSETPTFTDSQGDILFVNPAEYTRPEIQSVLNTGTTLSNKRYAKTKAVYRNYNMVISSDDILDPATTVSGLNTEIIGNDASVGIDFFTQFWIADYKYISVMNESNGVWSDFRRVVCDGDKMPLDFLDKILFYPEITLYLKETIPITRGTNGRYSL